MSFGVFLLGRYSVAIFPQEILEAAFDKWVIFPLRYSGDDPFSNFIKLMKVSVTDEVLPWILQLPVSSERKLTILRSFLLHEMDLALNSTRDSPSWANTLILQLGSNATRDEIVHRVELLIDSFVSLITDASKTVQEKVQIILDALRLPLRQKRFIDIEVDIERVFSPTMEDYIQGLKDLSGKLEDEAENASKAIMFVGHIMLEGVISLLVIISKVCFDSQFQQLLLAYLYYEFIIRLLRVIFSTLTSSFRKRKRASSDWEFDIWVATVESTYPYRIIRLAHLIAMISRMAVLILGIAVPSFFWYWTRNDVSIYCGILIVVYSWRQAKESAYMSIRVNADIAVKNWKSEGVKLGKLDLITRLEELVTYSGGIKDLGTIAWMNYPNLIPANPLQFLYAPGRFWRLLFYLTVPFFFIVDFLLKEILSLVFWTYRYGYLYPRLWNKRVKPELIQLLRDGIQNNVAYVNGVPIDPKDGWVYNAIRSYACLCGWHNNQPQIHDGVLDTPLIFLRRLWAFLPNVHLPLFIGDAIDQINLPACPGLPHLTLNCRGIRCFRLRQLCCCCQDDEPVGGALDPVPYGLYDGPDDDDPEGIIRGFRHFGIELEDVHPVRATLCDRLINFWRRVRCCNCDRDDDYFDQGDHHRQQPPPPPPPAARPPAALPARGAGVGLDDIELDERLLGSESSTTTSEEIPLQRNQIRILPRPPTPVYQDSESESIHEIQEAEHASLSELEDLAGSESDLEYTIIVPPGVSDFETISSESLSETQHPNTPREIETVPAELLISYLGTKWTKPIGEIFKQPGEDAPKSSSPSSTSSEDELIMTSNPVNRVVQTHEPIRIDPQEFITMKNRANIEWRKPSKLPDLFPESKTYTSGLIDRGFSLSVINRNFRSSVYDFVLQYLEPYRNRLHPLAITCRALLSTWIKSQYSGFEQYPNLKSSLPDLSARLLSSYDSRMFNQCRLISRVCVNNIISTIREQHRVLDLALQEIEQSERGREIRRALTLEFPTPYLADNVSSLDTRQVNARRIRHATIFDELQIQNWFEWSVFAANRALECFSSEMQRRYFQIRLAQRQDSIIVKLRNGTSYWNLATKQFCSDISTLYEQEKERPGNENLGVFKAPPGNFSFSYENLTIFEPSRKQIEESPIKLLGICHDWHLPARNVELDREMMVHLAPYSDRVDLDKYFVPNPTRELVMDGIRKYIPRKFTADFSETFGSIQFKTWCFEILDRIYNYPSDHRISNVDLRQFSPDIHLTPNSRKAFPGIEWSRRKYTSKLSCYEAALPVAEALQNTYALGGKSKHYWVAITVPKVCKRSDPQVRIACAPEMHYYIVNTMYLWDFVERSKMTPGRSNFQPFFMHFHDSIQRLFSRPHIRGEQVDIVQQGGRTPAQVLRLFVEWYGKKMTLRDRNVLSGLMEEQINAKIILPNIWGGDVLQTCSGWKDGAFGTSQIDSWVVTVYHLWQYFNAIRESPPSLSITKTFGPPLNWYRHLIVESHGDNWLSTYPAALEKWLSWSQNQSYLKQLGQEATIVSGSLPENFELMGFKILAHRTSVGDIIFVGYRPPEKTAKSLLYRRKVFRDRSKNDAYIRTIVVMLRFTDSWNTISREMLDEISARYHAESTTEGGFSHPHHTDTAFDAEVMGLVRENPSIVLGGGSQIWINRRNDLIFVDDDDNQESLD